MLSGCSSLHPEDAISSSGFVLPGYPATRPGSQRTRGAPIEGRGDIETPVAAWLRDGFSVAVVRRAGNDRNGVAAVFPGEVRPRRVIPAASRSGALARPASSGFAWLRRDKPRSATMEGGRSFDTLRLWQE